MFSPDAVSLTARNPRRRPRNASEDSIANKQSAKRRKRSGLSAETFQPPKSISVNGHIDEAPEAPATNGHAHGARDQRHGSVEAASLAIRHRGSKKGDKERRSSSGTGGIELTRNENFTVTQLSTTPDNLEDSHKKEAWRGEALTSMGYAIAMTATHATIWKYDQGVNSSEYAKPLNIRLLHPINNPHHPLPLGLLVPTSAEPALLVVTPTNGKITYWESLSLAASVDLNRQKQQSVQGSVGGMMSGEVVKAVTEAEPRGFILTMSTGRLAHLTISDSQGKQLIRVEYIHGGTPSGGVFGSIRSVFSSAGWRRDVAAVRAGRSRQRGQRYVTVATTTGTFQVWDLNWHGTHSMVHDIDAKQDLLNALSEGGEMFDDQQEHAFELVDFSIIQNSATGKELTKVKVNENSDCRMLALTVLKGTEASKFALIGLTLADGVITIDVVHPISCYETSLPAESEFRPQLLVPEPVQTAFVIFEKSVVLISLVEVEETPSSQLRVEAHSLPDPFQDVIDFRKEKSYRVVGCAPEPHDRNRGEPSCVVMIYGFGLIRVTVLPMKEGQSTLDRATVTARTKIEQAVFFGSQQQTLLDFAPRTEQRFSPEEIETAALDVNHSIMSSTSPYISAINPSMEQQLHRRSIALVDLNKHLRQHYQPLSRPGRWQLLWSAEKMAAARALWRCYDTIMITADKAPGYKNLYAELVEAISEKLKMENQPKNHETDGVRHYFIHDVWRLEWFVPYAQDIVEILFKESIEDQKDFDTATKARLTSEAADIHLVCLETAFRFREANASAYGLEEDAMIDGVLQQDRDYEDLPEFWTSTLYITTRVKNLTDLSRELAKHLDQEQDENDETGPYALMLKLALYNPRQVQICCQTLIERFRFLKSRKDPNEKAMGKQQEAAYAIVRTTLISKLAEIGLSENGFELAEKHRDMEALATIMDYETSHPPHPPIYLQKLNERINQYFVKFGMRWADAYFSRHFKCGKGSEILKKDSEFKPYLTKYLRNHPTYAKLSWINEVESEKDYKRATDALDLTQEQEKGLWSKKIALSMNKLTILAAREKDQAPNDLVISDILRIDKSVSVLRIQETLYNVIKSGVKDTIDAEAELDLAMEHYGNRSVEGKPYLKKRLRQNMRTLLAAQTLSPADLIDTLTLVSGDGSKPSAPFIDSGSFFLALNVLALTPQTLIPPYDAALLEKIIWRRCIIQDDWTQINRTELKPDTQVEIETASTSLFKTLLQGHNATSPTDNSSEFWSRHPPIPPADLLSAGTTPVSLVPPSTNPKSSTSIFSSLPSSTLTALSTDLQKESALLKTHLSTGRLGDWWPGVLEAAQSRAREDAEMEGEASVRREEVERRLRGRMPGGREEDEVDVVVWGGGGFGVGVKVDGVPGVGDVVMRFGGEEG